MAERRPIAAVTCRCASRSRGDRTAAAAQLARGGVLVLDVARTGREASVGAHERDAIRARTLPEAKRALFLAARRAARSGLAAATGCDPDCVVVDAPGDTRPRVAGLLCGGTLSQAVRDFGIGFSYAGDRALVALGRGLQVGVDIEAVPMADGRRRRYDAIREAYFADGPAIDALATDEEFLSAWTRHEAFLKACGAGITIPAARRDPAAEGYSVQSIDVGPSHVAAVAANAGSFALRLLPASQLGSA